MRMNRLFCFVLMACLVFPVSSYAQKTLEKVLGGAVIGAAVISTLVSKNKKAKAAKNADSEVAEATSETDDISASSSPGRIAGLKIVTNHPDLEIKLKRCQVNGKTCVIDLLMTNYGNDTTATFYTSDGSKAFDDEGNIYRIYRMGFGGTISVWDSHTVNLLCDTPVRCRIEIEGVSSSATLWKRILLIARCGLLGLDDNKPIMFYNIPITREGDE